MPARPPTYTRHAHICARFYELAIDMPAAAAFIWERTGLQAGQQLLFVGSLFGIAADFARRGAAVLVADYAAPMVALARERLPSVPVQRADLRALPYHRRFDAVVVAGRVFTHMVEDADLRAALQSCHAALRPGGTLFLDNYEDSRIERTPYFNGVLEFEAGAERIRRASCTRRISETPRVVRWEAHYSGRLDGNAFAFSDAIAQRAWSRAEILPMLRNAGLDPIAQGDNFDDTSFYTIARARPPATFEPAQTVAG
jgi:SAM-dependent methyltransferase